MNQFFHGLKSTVGCGYRGFLEAMHDWDSRLRTRYAYHYKHRKIKDNVVLYEAYFGKGMLCNPYAIFLELMEDPAYQHLTHVWVLKDMDADKELQEKYRHCKNVIFVKHHSGKYLKYLSSAKYLINNVTFPNYFTKKEGQVYINTWHGIPLKTLGYDMPNGGVETSNVIRNFLQVDYMISASPFLTDIYRKAYKLENIYQGKIIEEGYPRLDLLVKTSREEVFAKLRRYGVQVDSDKQIILFAPTWRGASYAQASSDVSFYYEFKEKLDKIVDTSRYQVLIKVHQRVYELAHDKLTAPYFIPSMVDANEVLAVTDILVSDFSSIYIDFLATGKPILFYIPDLSTYSQERGLYRSPDCLPGPCTGDAEQIGQWINDIEQVFAENKEKYDAERQWSNGYDAGSISRKIVDIVFGGKEEGYLVHKPTCEKKRILISRGKMLVNGISTSILSLLDNIDYDKYDVSVMILGTNREEELNLINRINPKARVICRNSAGCYTIGERCLQHYYTRTTYKNVFHEMYVRDVKRSYGDTRFDYVLDFEGYNTHYAIMCLQFPGSYKCIWQHNDMKAERDSRFPWLERIFNLYQHYDKLVSCSFDVMLVNRKNLAGTYCGPEKFSHMKNFVDVRRMDNLCAMDDVCHYDGQDYIVANEDQQSGSIVAQMLPLIPAMDEKGNRNHRFVTVGRFSGEKNHDHLIHAVHKLRQEGQPVYLYILGNGPLKTDMEALVNSLGLNDCVFMPGNVANPFAVMKNCDCFILPSLHEGQPMVIHEARGLKMPIIVSNFSSVGGVLVEDGQLVIGTEVEDIYRGMMKFIDGEVPAGYEYDIHTYNREAYAEFEKVLEQE